MRPTVHNLKHDRVNETRGDVYIGRYRPGVDPRSLPVGHNGYFGNPFHLGAHEPRGATIDRFRAYAWHRVEHDPDYRQAVLGLRGRRLFCFCAPQPCHGDVLAELCMELWEEEAPTQYTDACHERAIGCGDCPAYHCTHEHPACPTCAHEGWATCYC